MDIPYAEIANLVKHSSNYKKIRLEDIQIVKTWLAANGYPTGKSKNILATNTWRGFTAELVLNHCADIKSHSFTLQDLQQSKKFEIENFRKSNKHPFDKIRQQLQFLREDGFIYFVDNKGTYALTEIR